MPELTTPQQGVLLIDKPEGWSSHRVVNVVRRATGVKRVGHTGTLDPFATGLLIVLVGRQFTRLQDSYLKQDKIYECELVFGYATTTLDKTGEEVIRVEPAMTKHITREKIAIALQKLTGTYEQQAPAFAAIKINGVKLYEKARLLLNSEGEEKFSAWSASLPKRKITVYQLELLTWETSTTETYPTCRLKIHCSSGTYIRSLVRDLGELVGIPATTTMLRRTAIGTFTLGDANQPTKPSEWHWLTTEE